MYSIPCTGRAELCSFMLRLIHSLLAFFFFFKMPCIQFLFSALEYSTEYLASISYVFFFTYGFCLGNIFLRTLLN